ncbi:MAG TPA: hypothetical protein VHY37_11885 [Tepidisphaeraceae bacterium]|jgi:hypothetical protein|nr:hypothetical protein [Tepidisphaeraceae bacterium]
MALDEHLVQALEQALRVVDDHGTVGPRLVDDARRLWRRIEKFLAMGMVSEGIDHEALQVSTYALQLPLRRTRLLATGKPARGTLRERAEEAAELLIGVAPENVDPMLLDRAARMLQEMPHRSPVLDEAKLLADAVGLEDFGLIGLIDQAVQVARQGEGAVQLAEGAVKREQYGYWDARLKDGFHFDAVRAIAAQRLQRARDTARMLVEELADDGTTL